MASIALPSELAGLAARQHGTLAAEQLHSAGLSRGQINYRVDVGVLRPFLGDTFLIAGAPATPLAHYRAATMAVAESALGGRAAAHLHRLPRSGPVRPELIVGRSRSHPIDGITTLRRADLLDRHQCVVDGIPCTTIPRTVLDLAAYLSHTQLADLTDELVGSGRLSLQVLFDEFDRVARRGRNGTTSVRLVLEPRLADQFIPASKLHRRGLAFLRHHGFPRPSTEFKPPWAGPEVGRVDDAYPEHKLVIEWDGRTWHDRSDRFENDRLRDQLAMSHDWAVFRVTWRQLHADTVGLARRLRHTIDSRSGC